MRRWKLLLLSVLLAVLISVRGQDDFSLGDALPEENTKKPLVTQKTPLSDLDDSDLIHALGPDDPKPPPPANPGDTDNPKQDQPKGSDTFDDSDLLDGTLPRGGGGSDGSGGNERKGSTPKGGQEEEASTGAIAGIVSAVAATAIGAVSSFIAYQKKKLCFRQSADEENVNMDSHRGAQSEPPGDMADEADDKLQESMDRTGGNGRVQRTLLEN